MRMVRGTCENVRTLMRERQTILVFPVGAREVNKRRVTSATATPTVASLGARAAGRATGR
jgi:hypothetical protein